MYAVSPILFVALWWWSSVSGYYSEDILVNPYRVYLTCAELIYSGELASHLKVSFFRLFSGFSLGAVIGIMFGILMATSKKVESYAMPIFQALRQIPTITLIPILILMLGVDEIFKIIIVTKAAFLTVALSSYDATKGVSKQYIEVADIYQLSQLSIYKKVILPAITPPLFTGLRIAFSRSWTILVAAELLASDSGIGQMMQLGREMFRLDVVMVGVLITGIVGFGVDRLLKSIEQKLVPWHVLKV